VFKIRKATTDDIPLIRELTFQVWPQTYAAILSKEQIDYMLDMMYSESSLHNQITREGSQFILLYDENDPQGFAAYQELYPMTWKLHKIYILRSQQGKGAGKFVIDFIVNEISKQGAKELQLQVNRNNTAKGFYEKLGFTVLKEIKLDIGNGFIMDDFIMSLKL
jgi:ribosomal protein S18 acetylase RimI-like enzyme